MSARTGPQPALRASAASPVRRPVTVLFVDHAAGMGGAEHSLLALLAALDRERFRPVLAAVPGPLAERARELRVEVHEVPLARLRGGLAPIVAFRYLRGMLALTRLIGTARIDLVHANVLRAAVYAMSAARFPPRPRPLVWHVRDIHAPDPFVGKLCSAATAIVANSAAAARALPCAERARVVFNPVSLPASRPRSRAELGLPPTGPLVASVGRLRAWKGHQAFLEAAARVKDPEARFLIIGGRLLGDDNEDLDLPERLAGLARHLFHPDRVSLLGHRDDLADIWPHLALLVHTAEAEPFGRVVAEALLAGVPAVAFADGGVPEIVDDGETGILVPPGDIDGVAAGVDQLLRDGDARRRMGELGRARAAARFDPAAHARAMEAVFDDVLRSAPPAPDRSAAR